MNIYCKNCGREVVYSLYHRQWHHADNGVILCANGVDKAEPDDKHWNR